VRKKGEGKEALIRLTEARVKSRTFYSSPIVGKNSTDLKRKGKRKEEVTEEFSCQLREGGEKRKKGAISIHNKDRKGRGRGSFFRTG